VIARRLPQLAFYAGLVLAWSLVAWLEIWPPYVFPTPLSVLESLWEGLADQSFWLGTAVSLKRMVLGYGLSVAGGLALGLVVASSRFLGGTLGPLIVSLQTLPSICWLPLAVLWFGLSEQAIVFVVVMGSMLSITISTEAGIRHTPRIYALAGRNLGAHGLSYVGHVLLPAMLPHLLAGLKQGWAFAWRSLISGEMIFVGLGLGHLLMAGRDLNDMSRVVAVMVLILALGFVVDRLVFRVADRAVLRRWGLARP
jgi:NitT/TauT family transport system permease protein